MGILIGAGLTWWLAPRRATGAEREAGDAAGTPILAAVGAGAHAHPDGHARAPSTPPGLTRAGEVVDHWIGRILGRPMLAADRASLVDYLTLGGTDGDTLTTAMQGRIGSMIALLLDLSLIPLSEPTRPY